MSEHRYYWLKVNKDFFNSKRIKKLRRLAGGDTYTIIYLKMQLLATPTNGILTYTGLESTAAEEIALDIDEEAENVKIVLDYMLKTGLCELISDNEILLPYVVENTGTEGSSAKRMRELREKRKASLCDGLSSQCDTNVITKCAQRYGEIEIEKEKDNILSSKVEDVIAYLNEKTGKSFKSSTASTKKHISGRLNEGYTLEDFKRVIDIKCEQWLKDSKMSKYLRPDTLFSPGHFESYLNEAPKPKPVVKEEKQTEKIDLEWQRQFYDDEDEWNQQVEEWRKQGLV